MMFSNLLIPQSLHIYHSALGGATEGWFIFVFWDKKQHTKYLVLHGLRAAWFLRYERWSLVNTVLFLVNCDHLNLRLFLLVHSLFLLP
jgi:hypothetical protein